MHYGSTARRETERYGDQRPKEGGEWETEEGEREIEAGEMWERDTCLYTHSRDGDI